jgi:hypothetical protein
MLSFVGLFDFEKIKLAPSTKYKACKTFYHSALLSQGNRFVYY